MEMRDCERRNKPRGGGVTPLYGLYRYVLSQRIPKDGFLTVLVISRVSILADFGHFGQICFLRRSRFFIIVEKKIHKSPSQIMFTVI